MNITVSGLQVTLQSRAVLHGIDLNLAAGQIVGLLGPNGCGKSTLLRSLAGLLPRQAGDIYLNGTLLSKMSLRSRAKHLAFVPQHSEVDQDLSVEQIVRLGRTPHRQRFFGWNPADEQALEDAIILMQLSLLRKRTWKQLSGGERQRTQIARALAQQPKVLILDEPTNHLDIQYQLELLSLIAQLPMTVIVALHDLNLAANYCQRLVILKQGEVIANGSPETVLTPDMIEEVWRVKASVNKEEDMLCIRYPKR